MHKGRLRRVGLWTCMVVIAWGLGLAETAHAQKVGIVDLQAVLDQSRLSSPSAGAETLYRRYEPLYGGLYTRVS